MNNERSLFHSADTFHHQSYRRPSIQPSCIHNHLIIIFEHFSHLYFSSTSVHLGRTFYFIFNLWTRIHLTLILIFLKSCITLIELKIICFTILYCLRMFPSIEIDNLRRQQQEYPNLVITQKQKRSQTRRYSIF